MEYDAAMAASLLVLRAAYQAHVSLLMLDADNPRNRIANRYASANLRRAVEVLDASALRLDRKVEEALRP